MNRTTPLPRRRQRGVTLVEAGVTLAMVATLAASAAPSLQGLIDGRRLDAFSTQLAADLQLARTEAIARGTGVRLSLPADQACYVVHTGPAGACRCEAGETVARCDAGAAQIRTVRWSAAERLALASNSASIGFDPLHGTAAPTATLRVSSADGRVLQHVVNVMGRVRTCSLAGVVRGVRPC